MRKRNLFAVVLIVAVTAGCGSQSGTNLTSDSSEATTPEAAVMAAAVVAPVFTAGTLTKVTSPVSANGGMATSLQVKLTNSKGVALPSTVINFKTTSGVISATTATTNSSGVATILWVPSSAASQTVTATYGTSAVTWSPVIKNPTINSAALNAFLFTPPAGSSGFSTDLKPLTDPSPTYYCAINWNGAYCGLQRGGDLYDRQVHFSVWDAGNSPTKVQDASKSTCSRFTGEGTGVKCRFSYPWVVGNTYRFFVTFVRGATYTDITCNFTDVTKGVTQKIATVRQYQVVNYTYMNTFVEDFLPSTRGCYAIALRSATFSNPQMFNGTTWSALGTVTFSRADPTLNCANNTATTSSKSFTMNVGGSKIGNLKTAWGALL